MGVDSTKNYQASIMGQKVAQIGGNSPTVTKPPSQVGGNNTNAVPRPPKQTKTGGNFVAGQDVP